MHHCVASKKALTIPEARQSGVILKVVILQTEGNFTSLLSSSPIVTLPVQQGLSVAVQVSYWVLSPHPLLFIVQSNKEGRPLNDVQRSFVNAWAEVPLPHLSPRNPGKKHIHMQQIIHQFQSKNATTATVSVQRYILYTVLSSITFDQGWGTV